MFHSFTFSFEIEYLESYSKYTLYVGYSNNLLIHLLCQEKKELLQSQCPEVTLLPEVFLTLKS